MGPRSVEAYPQLHHGPTTPKYREAPSYGAVGILRPPVREIKRWGGCEDDDILHGAGVLCGVGVRGGWERERSEPGVKGDFIRDEEYGAACGDYCDIALRDLYLSWTIPVLHAIVILCSSLRALWICTIVML